MLKKNMREIYKYYLRNIYNGGNTISIGSVGDYASDARNLIKDLYDYVTKEEIEKLIIKIDEKLEEIKDKNVKLKSGYNSELKRYQTFLHYYLDNNCSIETSMESKEIKQLKLAYNKIYYGVPGCGKSYRVNNKYSKEEGYINERITFHTEYTYHDFIGFISPKTIDKTIEYKFSPGPFTRILKKAIKSDEKHVLIIEEINRGNTSGIFGDIFQLLDRDKEGSSEYFINNETISNYIYGNDTTKIRIPNNLYIVATANTSDQNTNVMDTAFLRRWEMKEVVIDYNKQQANFEIKEYQNALKADTWLEFIKNINSFLEENEEEAMASDKLIGQWFTKMKDLDNKNIDNFTDKVIRYLWEDVLKYNKYLLFNQNIKTFKKLKSNIKNNEDIFSERYLNKEE